MKALWAALALVVATLAAYWPALSGQFLWDDTTWITDDSSVRLLRDAHGLWRMWADIGALQQYFPVTGASFWIDHHLWGDAPLGYHVENVLLHAGVALIFGALLARLRVPGAWLAAALFALHPVMVESVAWLTERKNVLSGFFFMTALFSYAHAFSFWEAEEKAVRRSAYAVSLVCFILALLAKSSAVVLPIAVLLLAWWRRGRLRWRADILPSLPFFALGIAAGALSWWMEIHRVGASGAGWDLTLPQRVVVAGHAPWFYAMKLVWPAGICAVYPKWDMAHPTFLQWLYPASGIVVLAVLWLGRARLGKGLLARALFFAAALFPVLGFFNVYGMVHSFVADRWAYLPSLAFFAIVAAALTRLLGRRGNGLTGFLVAAPILLAMAWLTWSSAARFRDEITLWRATRAVNPNAWLAHYGLATELNHAGKVDDALRSYQAALELRPGDAYTLMDMGYLLFTHGRTAEGLYHLREAVLSRPSYAPTHYTLGTALLNSGDFAGAIGQLERAVELDPTDAPAYNTLGVAYLDSGDSARAIESLERSVELDPTKFPAWSNLGNAHMQKGQTQKALECYQRALEIQPDAVEALSNYGAVLAQMGRMDEALVQLRRALKLRPGNANVITNLKYVLQKLGRSSEIEEMIQPSPNRDSKVR